MSSDAHQTFERSVAERLRHVVKTARMWGSPQELEAVAQHFTHVWLASRTTAWSFEQTRELWAEVGGPFAGDADEHALMRSKLWATQEEAARLQVVSGFVCVWAALGRAPERERRLAPWIEYLLDNPHVAGAPDQLNMVLFALMGFVSSDAKHYVELLQVERLRIGGHELRAFPVVAPLGPSEASLTYTRKFESWSAVTAGIASVLERLTAQPP